MSTRILVIEDEPAVASVIQKALTEEGYEISIAMDGVSARDHVHRFEYELLVMDVMIPGINGIDLTRQLRKADIHTPILMLTALGSTDNIVSGLDAGADDYLTKPFKIAELLARVRSLLRRQPSTNTPQNTLIFSDITLNLDEKNARRNSQTIDLTAN